MSMCHIHTRTSSYLQCLTYLYWVNKKWFLIAKQMCCFGWFVTCFTFAAQNIFVPYSPFGTTKQTKNRKSERESPKLQIKQIIAWHRSVFGLKEAYKMPIYMQNMMQIVLVLRSISFVILVDLCANGLCSLFTCIWWRYCWGGGGSRYSFIIFCWNISNAVGVKRQHTV